MRKETSFLKNLTKVLFFILLSGVFGTFIFLNSSCTADKKENHKENLKKEQVIKVDGQVIKILDEKNDSIKTLEKENDLLKESLKKLHTENVEIKEKLSRLGEILQKTEVELASLKPKHLPEFHPSDLRKDFNVRRVFSTKTGNCFSANGNMSCFYCKVKTGDNSHGYLVYKANKEFKNADNRPDIYDENGHKLQIITSAVAKEIIKWEEENSDTLIRLMFY
jgi:hypothetical protein